MTPLAFQGDPAVWADDARRGRRARRDDRARPRPGRRRGRGARAPGVLCACVDADGDEGAIPPGPWDTWLERDARRDQHRARRVLAQATTRCRRDAAGDRLRADTQRRYVTFSRKNSIVRRHATSVCCVVVHLGPVVVREGVLGAGIHEELDLLPERCQLVLELCTASRAREVVVLARSDPARGLQLRVVGLRAVPAG